jgi:transcriptional antiterminator RfaH
MSAWCVVNTLPGQEIRAETNLLRQGFRAWLPAILKIRRHARRVDTVRAPLFPGYLFVQLDLDREAWSPINSTYGVRRLLAQDARPETLHARFVADLQKTVGEDGTCAVPPECEGLLPGAQVRVVWGPFADSVATILELAPKERVLLLLDLLGGKVKTTISRLALVPET